jgi:outer membrane protein OmpA-like peptidoglycan-associated protein
MRTLYLGYNPAAMKTEAGMQVTMRKLRLTAMILLVAGAGYACATKAGTGALIGGGAGAVVGAGVGAVAGGGKGAAIGGVVGAGVGAGTGALIGNYMDKQEAELKKVKGANVQREGDKLIVRFNSAILFDTGKSKLKAASEKDLSDFAGVLKQYPETNIVVEGHTDNVGKKTKNKKLSETRAGSVIGYLDSQGVVRARMTGVGYADDRPVGDNKTDEGRQANRRVEIQISANEKLQQQQQQQAPQGQQASASPAHP